CLRIVSWCCGCTEAGVGAVRVASCVHLSCILTYCFNHTSPTYIYTLSLHDALPISRPGPAAPRARAVRRVAVGRGERRFRADGQDRKSTRLNSSHEWISYAVFCLKKKKIPVSYTLTHTT